MSADRRRKIERLRALAGSTPFPAEAESALRKATALEAQLDAIVGPQMGDFVLDRILSFPTFEEAWNNVPPGLREQMETQQTPEQRREAELRRAEREFDAWLREQLDDWGVA